MNFFEEPSNAEARMSYASIGIRFVGLSLGALGAFDARSPDMTLGKGQYALLGYQICRNQRNEGAHPREVGFQPNRGRTCRS
jgi:hypothetical protein